MGSRPARRVVSRGDFRSPEEYVTVLQRLSHKLMDPSVTVGGEGRLVTANPLALSRTVGRLGFLTAEEEMSRATL